MGNCLGRCLCGKNGLRRSTDQQEKDDLVSVGEEEATSGIFIFKIIKFKNKKRPQFIDQFWERHDNTNYSLLNQQNNGSTVDSSEIQLQCLDAQTLLVTTAAAAAAIARDSVPITKFDNISLLQQQQQQQQQQAAGYCGGPASSSRASSSLDLEWEHEYANNNPTISNNGLLQNSIPSQQSWLFLPEDLTSRINASTNQYRHDESQYDQSEKQSNFNSTNNLLGSQNSIVLMKNPGLHQSQTNNLNNNYYHNNSNNCTQINNTYSTNNISTKCAFNRTPSRTSWSHISTPESLEWDIDEEQQKELRVEDDNLDHETLELLHDIEMLKNKVLNETGDGLETKQKFTNS